jgi:hypothetical protein
LVGAIVGEEEGLPAQARGSGGRTRARTWDPLIKSQRLKMLKISQFEQRDYPKKTGIQLRLER